jgi:hypothetical protein
MRILCFVYAAAAAAAKEEEANRRRSATNVIDLDAADI